MAHSRLFNAKKKEKQSNKEYEKESKLFYKEKNEQEKNEELIACILKTKNDLVLANKNFEYAEEEMIDYFLYQIKAYQAKLDYLVKQAKIRKIEVDIKDALYYKENKVV